MSRGLACLRGLAWLAQSACLTRLARRMTSAPLAWLAPLVCAIACRERPAALEVHDAWARPTMAVGAEPDLSVPGVVYLTLRNRGPDAAGLAGARSAVCRRVELHRTTTVDGRSRMQAVEGDVPVAAGASVELSPGGLHLMLIGLQRGLVAGDTLPLVLEFADGDELAVEVTVRAP